ncbi:MAG: sterol desaturase family protein [Bacillus sp. (in: firmicutes)]|uniref:sterol desaturase family protein n=1 Tax=Bacillus sp. TaxID=1409 RepID=UPI0039E617A7
MKRVVKEFFLHTNIVIMFYVLLIFIIFLNVNFFTWIGITSCLMGIIFYTINEYVTHRFIFHIKPPKNQFLLKILRRLHYDHHVYPDDLKLLFLPIWYSSPIFLMCLLFLYGFARNVTITFSFGVGMITMFLIYEWKHYIAHKPIRPFTQFGRWLKKQHLLHHYKNEHYWFGVSNPLYDFLFRTYKNEKEVELSKTARNLERKKNNELTP